MATAALGVLVTAAATAAPAVAATPGPTLAVDAAADVHAIPDTIYGINWASDSLRTALRVPVNRWGGNETSLYNYKGNAYNNGLDWFFENQVGDDANHRIRDWVPANQADGTASLVTVPMLGWVADPAKPAACAFSESKYPGQDAHDTWRPDCGNGRKAGAPVVGNDPTDFALKVNRAAWASDFVKFLVARYGSAAHGGVKYYALDNEPGLWNNTHRSVHPKPLSRTELIAKSTITAAAVKGADPNARVLGPADWGYCGWLYAPADGDPANHCDPPATHPSALSADYVRAFKAYADAHGGRRLLDYLDQHYYPAAPNGAERIALAPAGNAETQARRLKSTRSLWDPTYTDDSWIGGVNDVNAPPLKFIRKLRAWAALYPGTKTAISEYNWGAFESINGALAQADVLGIFGRERLDLATLWNYDDELDGTPVEWALRIYRNYDGSGARFGSTGVSATSTNQDDVSVYAGKRAGKLTIVVVNKSSADRVSAVNVANYPHLPTGRAFTLAPAHPTAITSATVAIGTSGLTHTFPAQSVTLLEITHS